MEYIIEKIEGRPKDAPKKFKVSCIETVKDVDDKDVRIPKFIGNITIEHLEQRKASIQKEMDVIDERIAAINKYKNKK